MQQVEGAQTCLHRGLAVGRGPRRAQPAIGPRLEAQCALALLVKDELVVDEMALAAAPFGRFVLVDTRPYRIDRIQILSANIVHGEKDLTTVRVEAVPSFALAPVGARNRMRG